MEVITKKAFYDSHKITLILYSTFVENNSPNLSYSTVVVRYKKLCITNGSE